MAIASRLGSVLLLLVVAACSTPTGNAQTDKAAADAARGLSSPRQHSADALVRAAVHEDGVSVIEAQDLDAEGLTDPLARLVFRVHQPGGLSGFVRSDPVTACYEVLFNWYGVKGSPSRIDCPDDASAITPSPRAPTPQVTIPSGFDGTLAKLLTAFPEVTSAAVVNERVTRALPRGGLLPVVAAAMSARDVGVSLWDADSRDCLLGARIAGEVTVWSPSRVQLQPGELSCDPQTALQLAGLRPPH